MQRRFVLSSLILFIFCSGCVIDESFFYNLDNEETILLNNDRTSGNYSLQFSLNDFLVRQKKLLQSQRTGASVNRVDTTLDFNTALGKNAGSLSDTEREMFLNGSARIMVNFSDLKGFVVIKLFFKNAEMLAFEREHILRFIKKNIESTTRLLLSKLQPRQAASESQKEYAIDFHVSENANKTREFVKSIGLNPAGKAFEFKIANSRVTNTFLDSGYYKTIMALPEFIAYQKEQKGYHSFFRTTFILPGKITGYTGKVGKIASDKRTITFMNRTEDIFNKPRLLEYAVRYQ